MSNQRMRLVAAGMVLGGMALAAGGASGLSRPGAARVTKDEGELSSPAASAAALLAKGQLRVSRAVLREWDGTEHEGDLVPRGTRLDLRRKTFTQTYRWGAIRCDYTAQKNRVNLALRVTNTSASILQGLSFSLGPLRLPASAKDLPGSGEMRPGVDAPGVVTQDWGGGTLAFCNEDVGRPLYVGWLPAGDARTLAFQAATFREDRFPRGWLTTPKIDRPIYPGETDHLALSLRLGPSGASSSQMAGDLFRKFARAYPFTLNWSDRRPIGTLHLGAVEYRRPDNPRGWFAGDGSVATTTEAGRAAFRVRLLRYAEESITVLKSMNAQGMIVWDIEGDEYPHATTYLGDPRSLPAEIAPIADAFFKKFTDAGLRVGLCLRPSQPVRSLYDGDAWQLPGDDPAFVLNTKIAYARKRWGCSLFYVDSNVVYDPRFAPNDGAGYELLPATVFQRVAAANPDALLLPEQKDGRYYAYTAPYMELRQGYAGTPENVRALYPNSFSAIYAPDGPIESHRAELAAAVKRGDILLFRAWWPDPVNAAIQSIYAEARK